MEKSIHSARYRVFLKVLREARRRAGLSQAQVAEQIGETQTFVSKCERGTTKPAAAEQVQRDLEMALAILWRAGCRLTEALPEMNAAQQEQAQREIESAHRELNRMAGRIGKEQEGRHAEPGAARRDSGVAPATSEQARDRTRIASVAPHGAQSPAIELRQCAGDPAPGESRTLSPTDSGSVGFLQGESRASP